MTPPVRRKLLLATLCVLALMSARALLSLVLLKQGFRALSDDDYSRVVIAQSFAEHPGLDPSKTSWLPFPFWLYGTVMFGFGKSLATARAVAFVVGLLSAASIWQAARWLGLSRGASLLGGLIACIIPYSAWLGLATTPDVFSASLMLLGFCSLTRRHGTIRSLGALAIMAASLSRYEAWPAAAVWALYSVLDAMRTRRGYHALLALLVLAPPLLWMLHGIGFHHDAFFFVKRVTNYHRALGLSNGQGFMRLLSTPQRLLLDVPELWTLAVVVGTAAARLKVHRWRRQWARPTVGVIGVIAFLCVGDWRDGTATHHVGRTLLVAWYLVALVVAGLSWAATTMASRRQRALLWVSSVSACVVAAISIRPIVTSTDGFCPRTEEVLVGELAAAQIPRGERLAIDTPDYGYFAVQAAFARPSDVDVLNKHDPRSPQKNNWFESSNATRQFLSSMHAPWIVASVARGELLAEFASIKYRGSTLLLARVR